MKLDPEIEDFLDLEAEQEHQKQQEFWDKVQEFLRYGVPSTDKKGHRSELRICVRPFQVDIINSIREKMPDGWFKSQASLVRSLIAVGCFVSLNYLEEKYSSRGCVDVDWKEILGSLNRISKTQRLKEFVIETRVLENDIANLDIDTSEKVKTIDNIRKLRKNFLRG